MDQRLFEELTALAAIGALDDRDAREFQLLLDGADESMQREVNDYYAAASLLGHFPIPPVAPPPRIKDELMKRVRASAPFRIVRGDGTWSDHPSVSGVKVRELSWDPDRQSATILMRLEPGTSFPRHEHRGTEQCYILEGDAEIGGVTFAPGDYLQAAAGSTHAIDRTVAGCTLLLVVSREDYLAG